jgi:hypothetical protein
LPRAFEFEAVTRDLIHVRVDAHVFIFVVDPDRVRVSERRVRKGGRRSHRPSDEYRKGAFEFAKREARARRLIAEVEGA